MISGDDGTVPARVVEKNDADPVVTAVLLWLLMMSGTIFVGVSFVLIVEVLP